MSSFQSKQLRVTFTLGNTNATFAGTSSNQLVLTNLRTLALMSGALGFLWQLDLQVYGMRPQDMNALTVITVPGQPTAIGKNQVLLEGNQGDGQWYTLFNGIIIEGGPEYRTMPEVFYHCQAVPLAYFAGKAPTSPLSYQAGAQVSQVVSTIGQTLGVATTQTNGVSGSVATGAYLAGSPIDQLSALKAKSGNAFDWTIDPDNTLQVIPANPYAPRAGGTQFILSPTTGLVGYPTPEVMGIGVVALFEPALLGLGSQIEIKDSDIPAANGLWMAYSMDLQLEAVRLSGGQWYASMHCIALPS
jgi:hypothetical protein